MRAMYRDGRTSASTAWLSAVVWPCLTNAGIAAFLYLLMRYALSPEVQELARRGLVFSIVVVCAASALFLVGTAVSTYPLRRSADRRTAAVRTAVVRLPLRQSLLAGLLWTLTGVVATCAAAVAQSVQMAIITVMCMVLGGIAGAALTYFITERTMRPITASVLDGTVFDEVVTPTVRVRIVTAWLVGSALPIFGVLLVAADIGLADGAGQPFDVRRAVIALAAIALIAGGLATWLASGAVGDPVHALRAAARDVEDGDLSTRVEVYDTTELGRLQAGFNAMVSGLAERQRLRDMFGRYVGEDVARRAVDTGISLGGTETEVAVLFVDLVGSTTLADRQSPTEVVRLLNRFFETVIEVIDTNDGFVNKFQGDAVLAVFGAPIVKHDACTAALSAARTLSTRLGPIAGPAGFGIGVSAGTAIAGHVGSSERFEYTVIGTPVNEAARLTELAKDSAPARVLAAAPVVRCADRAEQQCWRIGESVHLRGRLEETVIARPVG